MLIFALTIFLALVTLIAVSLLKVYTHVSRTELKRRARSGDEFAKLLYRAAAYGMSLQLLLWTLIGLTAAGFFVLTARTLPSWLALISSGALIWLGFVWLPNTRVTIVSNTLARYLTTPLSWLLSHLYPLLNRLADWARHHRTFSVHSGLYQKEDIIELLDKQKNQTDNRVTDDELRIVTGALTFGDKLVRDILTPRRIVKMVAVTDAVGPLLMDELHDSGHSRFPVYQDKPDNIVGMLYVKDLLEQHTAARVRDVMKKSVYYVHEDQSLREVLQAFLKTKHHLFIVVNGFEEIVGIVSIEDVLEQILGKPILDEFDKYDDLRAVAALKAQKEHQQNRITDKEAVSPDEPKVLE